MVNSTILSPKNVFGDNCLLKKDYLKKMRLNRFKKNAHDLLLCNDFDFLLLLLKALKEAFKIFDKNRNGYIEAKELKSVTTTLGQTLTEEEFAEFWKEADKNHDGKLDYEEFIKMMTQY